MYFYFTDIPDDSILKFRVIFKSEPKIPTKTYLVFSLDNTSTEKIYRIMEECNSYIYKFIKIFMGYHIDY